MRTRITVMARTMANLTPERGMIRDIGAWGVRISTTSLKFISIPRQPLKQIPSFINVSSAKIPLL